MSDLSALGIWNFRRRPGGGAMTELIVTQRPLSRILAHTGFSIDHVVNSPIAKNAVLGYFKLDKQIQRRSEIVDLERQWNPL
jgi:hypothetical protein